MAVDKRIKYEDKGPVIQGGVQNYLGKQPQVMAPRKWKSAPDKPATELAYITEAEKKLIMKADIHGGLERGPNMGPSGIMSLDSFGDADTGVSGGLSGGDVSAAESGSSFAGANTIGKDYGAGLRAGVLAAGGAERLNEPQSFIDQARAIQQKYNYNPNRGSGLFGNILSGVMGLVNPFAGLAMRGFINLRDRFGPEFERFKQSKTLDEYFNPEKYKNQTTWEEKINRDLINEPETPIFARTYLDSVAARNNVPKGNLYQDHTYDFYQGDKGITSLSNKFSPDISNQVAYVTEQDIARRNMQLNEMKQTDYQTAKDIGLVNPNITEYEYNQLIQGNITKPGTYVG
jgi:hypothetical protein